MEPDDFFSEEDFVPDEEPNPNAALVEDDPDFRATFLRRRRELALSHWYPGMMDRRMAGMWLEVWNPDTPAVAELRRIGEAPNREVSATFLDGKNHRWTEPSLKRWAHAAGYRRLWLPGRLITLDPLPPANLNWSTRCRDCGFVWNENCAEFWRHVRGCGVFPIGCPVCGADLPQGKVVSRFPSPHDRDGRSVRART